MNATTLDLIYSLPRYRLELAFVAACARLGEVHGTTTDAEIERAVTDPIEVLRREMEAAAGLLKGVGA